MCFSHHFRACSREMAWSGGENHNRYTEHQSDNSLIQPTGFRAWFQQTCVDQSDVKSNVLKISPLDGPQKPPASDMTACKFGITSRLTFLVIFPTIPILETRVCMRIGRSLEGEAERLQCLLNRGVR